MRYDVIIVGAGPGGIFTAYELVSKAKTPLKVGVFEMGKPLAQRKCPIDGEKIRSCIRCRSCSIMSGFGGAGAFSDGKYNITNEFGGNLHEYIGKAKALELMRYVDRINLQYGGEGTRLYSTANTSIRRRCLENGLHLLNAEVRHLGTDINYVVLQRLYDFLKGRVDFHFDAQVKDVRYTEGMYSITAADETHEAPRIVISVGRSGSKWMEHICREMGIQTHRDRKSVV